MEIAIRHSLQNNTPRDAGKTNYRVIISWLLTILIVILGLKYADSAIAGLLTKLYELLIQKIN